MTKPSPEAARELRDLAANGVSMFDLESDDAMGQTDCEDGCVVEPDGQCSHGYESAALTAGLI